MRRQDREVTDLSEIRQILDKAQVLHLAMIDGGKPYVVPLHYGYTLEEGRLTFFLHSAKEGRKLDVLQKNGAVAFVLETDVSMISGGELACKYGSAYASVMGDGQAALLADSAEKAKALQILMNTQTGRDFVITPAMAESVAVIRVEVETFSAKARRKQ